MDMNTENYQLKWHSFGSYLHGCVAAALNGDQFADVALITLDGRQINAHRFILSACSQYLHQVLKLQPKASASSHLSIIMPPEINHKTLRVLVQYMYSGETTVSQEILESVLRGGDLLKVKGLWRPKEEEEGRSDKSEKTDRSGERCDRKDSLSDRGERIDRDRDRDKEKRMKVSSRHSRDSCQSQSQANVHSNSSRSNASTPSQTYAHSHNSACSTPVPNNSVIKEPRALYDRGGEKYDKYESMERLEAVERASNKIDKADRADRVDKHKPDRSERSEKIVPTKRSKHDESVIKTTQQTPPPLAPIQIRHKQERQDRQEREKQRLEQEKLDKDKHKSNNDAVANESQISTAKDLMQILVIKEEPLEWSEVNQEEIELVEREEIFDSELIIKPEIQMDDGDDHPENLYTPLTCELCAETFTLPADWVKHVQTHTDMMPAKRQKRGRPSNDEDNSNFPPLQCDMCQAYFATPAKWVQHIQCAHTEQEMQHANKSTSRRGGGGGGSNERPTQRASGGGGQAKITSQHKVCVVCNKKFPSHASMIIHRRTHTGERPYMCHYCCKGFNVKSNLLRHLRTLHDKYVSPNDIESKEGDESDV